MLWVSKKNCSPPSKTLNGGNVIATGARSVTTVVDFPLRGQYEYLQVGIYCPVLSTMIMSFHESFVQLFHWAASQTRRLIPYMSKLCFRRIWRSAPKSRTPRLLRQDIRSRLQGYQDDTLRSRSTSKSHLVSAQLRAQCPYNIQITPNSSSPIHLMEYFND